MKNLKRQLNTLSELKPSSRWKALNKDILMQRISVKESSSVQNNWSLQIQSFWNLFMKNTFVYRFAQSGAMFALSSLMLFFGTQAAVTTAKDSLPGDNLYFVKTTLEQMQLKLAKDAREQVTLEVTFAKNRLDEIRELISQNRTETQNLTPALEGIKENYQSVASKLDHVNKVEGSSESKALEIAEIVDFQAEALKNSIAATTKEVEDSFVVKATIASVEEAGMKALKVMAEKAETGTVNVSEEENVKEIILNKISESQVDEEEKEESFEKANSLLEQKDFMSAVEVLEENSETQEVVEEDFSVEGSLLKE